MTLADTRADIAASIGYIDGVTGSLYRPNVIAPGQGWPLLGAMDRSGGLGFLTTWKVVIVVARDEQAASVWIDTHIDDVVENLEPVGFIERMEPSLLATSAGDMYALTISMRSE